MMSTIKKSNNSIFINPISCHPWEEEEALAEDADQGPLGGFVWPPTSYSCSFCKREFRSAQALGGHMNVHRTERARLKQTAVNGTISIAPPQKQTLCKPLGKEISLDSNSDTKSSGVYDEDFLEISCGNGTDIVETNLVLGLGLGSCSSRGSGCKRQKTDGAPLVMEGLDLELRLA